MGKRIVTTLLACAALSVGCASVDKVQMTSFDATGGSAFRLGVRGTSVQYRLDEEGERQRIEWLEEYLAANKLCPDGYLVEDRTVLSRGAVLGIQHHEVVYRGRCKGR